MGNIGRQMKEQENDRCCCENIIQERREDTCLATKATRDREKEEPSQHRLKQGTSTKDGTTRGLRTQEKGNGVEERGYRENEEGNGFVGETEGRQGQEGKAKDREMDKEGEGEQKGTSTEERGEEKDTNKEGKQREKEITMHGKERKQTKQTPRAQKRRMKDASNLSFTPQLPVSFPLPPHSPSCLSKSSSGANPVSQMTSMGLQERLWLTQVMIGCLSTHYPDLCVLSDRRDLFNRGANSATHLSSHGLFGNPQGATTNMKNNKKSKKNIKSYPSHSLSHAQHPAEPSTRMTMKMELDVCSPNERALIAAVLVELIAQKRAADLCRRVELKEAARVVRRELTEKLKSLDLERQKVRTAMKEWVRASGKPNNRLRTKLVQLHGEASRTVKEIANARLIEQAKSVLEEKAGKRVAEMVQRARVKLQDMRMATLASTAATSISRSSSHQRNEHGAHCLMNGKTTKKRTRQENTMQKSESASTVAGRDAMSNERELEQSESKDEMCKGGAGRGGKRCENEVEWGSDGESTDRRKGSTGGESRGEWGTTEKHGITKCGERANKKEATSSLSSSTSTSSPFSARSITQIAHAINGALNLRFSVHSGLLKETERKHQEQPLLTTTTTTRSSRLSGAHNSPTPPHETKGKRLSNRVIVDVVRNTHPRGTETKALSCSTSLAPFVKNRNHGKGHKRTNKRRESSRSHHRSRHPSHAKGISCVSIHTTHLNLHNLLS